jgi:hypothetical protein
MTLVPLLIFGNVAIITIANRTAKNFHIKALNTLMGAPLRFFTTTDTGITTNRFAEDMLLLDLDITYGIIVIAEITGTVG